MNMLVKILSLVAALLLSACGAMPNNSGVSSASDAEALAKLVGKSYVGAGASGSEDQSESTTSLARNSLGLRQKYSLSSGYTKDGEHYNYYWQSDDTWASFYVTEAFDTVENYSYYDDELNGDTRVVDSRNYKEFVASGSVVAVLKSDNNYSYDINNGLSSGTYNMTVTEGDNVYTSYDVAQFNASTNVLTAEFSTSTALYDAEGESVCELSEINGDLMPDYCSMEADVYYPLEDATLSVDLAGDFNDFDTVEGALEIEVNLDDGVKSYSGTLVLYVDSDNETLLFYSDLKNSANNTVARLYLNEDSSLTIRLYDENGNLGEALSYDN